MLTVDPSSDEPIYLQIVNQIKRDVILGIRRPGDKLETIKELAARLGIAPPTVGQAYERLSADKIVVSRKSQGTFVVNPPRELLVKYGFSHLVHALRDCIAIGMTREEIDTQYQIARSRFKIARSDDRRIESNAAVIENDRRANPERRTTPRK